MSAPNGKNDKISYFQAKAPIWVTNAAALGVPTALAASLQTKTDAARAAYEAQQEAKAAWLTALGNCNIAVREMALVGGQVLTFIAGTAKVEGDAIYTLAGLPIPPVPAPVPPPGAPYAFKVSLDGNGSLNISWKADNPRRSAGTIYRVCRTIDGGPQTHVGDTGTRKFIDATVPAGTSQVVYAIQGVRTTAAGPWSNFVVKFGTGAGGAATATVAESTPASIAKLAA